MALALLEKLVVALVVALALLAVDDPGDLVVLTLLATPLLLMGLMYAVGAIVER